MVRASMGAIFDQTFVRCRFDSFAHWVRRHRALVIGASPEASLPPTALGVTRRPLVLLLGAERKGLSQEQRALCEKLIAIPMAGKVDSLNLSAAGSILLYELLGRHLPVSARD